MPEGALDGLAASLGSLPLPINPRCRLVADAQEESLYCAVGEEPALIELAQRRDVLGGDDARLVRDLSCHPIPAKSLPTRAKEVPGNIGFRMGQYRRCARVAATSLVFSGLT